MQKEKKNRKNYFNITIPGEDKHIIFATRKKLTSTDMVKNSCQPEEYTKAVFKCAPESIDNIPLGYEESKMVQNSMRNTASQHKCQNDTSQCSIKQQICTML
jgi:hypothetical protein